MKTSIITIRSNKHNKNKMTNKRYRILGVLFWLVIWQLISHTMPNAVVLSSPIEVGHKFVEVCQTQEFWVRMLHSFYRIVAGFSTGVVLGVVIALVTYNVKWMDIFVRPLVLVMKSTPVASFIILALIWVGSEWLATFIAFLMVFPIIYINMTEGFNNIDSKMLEMSQVFRLSYLKKFRYIYIPSVLPYFMAGITISLGLCWKAGIAAEVIGIPVNSIGERLYEAKIFLETEEIFVWTVVIIVLSLAFEKMILWLIKAAYHKMGGSYGS